VLIATGGDLLSLSLKTRETLLFSVEGDPFVGMFMRVCGACAVVERSCLVELEELVDVNSEFSTM
jgi:hypothetical protein